MSEVPLYAVCMLLYTDIGCGARIVADPKYEALGQLGQNEPAPG